MMQLCEVVVVLCGIGGDNIDIQSFFNEYINAIISVEGTSMDETHGDSKNIDTFWDIFSIHGFLGFGISFVGRIGGDTEICIQDFNMALDTNIFVVQ